MKKQSCLLAAALLVLSLSACSAPSASVAKTVYKPARIEQTKPITLSDTAENPTAFADVPLSFSVGDKTTEKATDATNNTADPAPETSLQEGDETNPAVPTAPAATEEQATTTTRPASPASPAKSAGPEQSPSPTESSIAVNAPALAPEQSSAQLPQPEQPPAQNAQPEPAPDPIPVPEPTPAPAPEPAPDPAPVSQPVDIDAILQQAQTYGLSLGLEWDATATDCWDNPIAATPQSLYVLRDLCARLDWYSSSGFEAFCVWSESTGDSSYLVYVGYA